MEDFLEREKFKTIIAVYTKPTHLSCFSSSLSKKLESPFTSNDSTVQISKINLIGIQRSLTRSTRCTFALK
jgi:hypothetical protein